ncbi:MAG: LpxD N-terminal domain-containing protein [Bacteroidota bacterium]
MKFPQPIPVAQLAEQFGATLIGDEKQLATGINEIHKVEAGDITFADNEKYFNKALRSAATIVLLNKPADCPPGKTLLICSAPFEVYNQLIITHRPFRPLSAQVSETAQVHPSAILEPNVTIGPHVQIGAYSYIQSNVYIAEYTQIGKHVTIQAGSIIGTDAFYFKKNEEVYKKWRSGGRVIIHDHVDIGASCTINKGVSGDTVIGEGTKIDCQVHIGHGAVVGRNCLIAAQVGIGGKTILGDEVVLYGQVGIAQNLVIGDKAIFAAKSGVSKSLEGGKVYFGSPADEIRTRHRELAALRKLPEFMKKKE